ncbi:MAG: CoA ester lyase, partial [Spirochaetia bacterium]|nr:CoA ester lyase [Spirochaetia bacterium]
MRSWLYTPANTPSRMINAGIYGSDGVVFDLEDSIAPDQKDEARFLLEEM